jgi:hypothetical protein
VNDWSTVGFPYFIDIFSQTIWCLHQNGLVSDLEISPFTIYKVFASLYLFPIEVLVIRVGDAKTGCGIMSLTV